MWANAHRPNLANSFNVVRWTNAVPIRGWFRCFSCGWESPVTLRWFWEQETKSDSVSQIHKPSDDSVRANLSKRYFPPLKKFHVIRYCKRKSKYRFPPRCCSSKLHVTNLSTDSDQTFTSVPILPFGSLCWACANLLPTWPSAPRIPCIRRVALKFSNIELQSLWLYDTNFPATALH